MHQIFINFPMFWNAISGSTNFSLQVSMQIFESVCPAWICSALSRFKVCVTDHVLHYKLHQYVEMFTWNESHITPHQTDSHTTHRKYKWSFSLTFYTQRILFVINSKREPLLNENRNKFLNEKLHSIVLIRYNFEQIEFPIPKFIPS